MFNEISMRYSRDVFSIEGKSLAGEKCKCLCVCVCIYIYCILNVDIVTFSKIYFDI